MASSVSLISAVNPYPADAGKKVVLAGFVDYLSERFGPDNVHYLLIGGDEEAASADFPVTLHRLPRPSRSAAVGNVMLRTATGRASIQESLLRSATVGRAIADVLTDLRPSLEVYDTVRCAQYAPSAGGDRQICYLDDLFSERYAAVLEASRRFPDVDVRPLGGFVNHVPSRLRPLADFPPSQRALLLAEQRLVRRSEDRAARRFRRSILVNDNEAATLRVRAGVPSDRVWSVPPLAAPPARSQRPEKRRAEFAFLGLLSLPHNDDGLRYFLTQMWPHVLRLRPDARLRIIGRDPRPELIEVVSTSAGVSLEGFVPDLTALLDEAAAMVNPLRFGSGVKLKVIEALGRGLPVVSTAVGADGIASGPEEGVLVGAGAVEFAELLVSTLDQRNNAKLSAAAAAHFTSRYARPAVFAAYDAAFTFHQA